MRSGVVGGGNIVRRVGKGLIRSKGALLIAGTDLADGILGAIIPGDARLAVYVDPLAMHVAERALRIAILVERNEEVVSTAITHFPFPQEMPRKVGTGCR